MTVDIALTADGDLPARAALVTGPALTVQRAQIRLRTWLGEWILDRTVGLPFFDWLRASPAPVDTIAARLRLELADIPGVLRVETLQATLDRGEQSVSFTGRVLIAGLDDEVQIAGALGASPTNSHPFLTMTWVTPSGPIIPSIA